MAYSVKKTDSNKSAIAVDENVVIQDELDIAVFGRRKLLWGELMNENLLHLLENFSCPESSPGYPDTSQAIDDLLTNPTDGQLWYNETQECIFFWDESRLRWTAWGMYGDAAANWGVIANGEQLPLPVSPTGRTYDYDECSWVVSPFNYIDQPEYMICGTTNDAIVTSRYIVDAVFVDGYANYLIVGIRGNQSVGIPTPTPTISLTPTPTPTIGSSPTPTPTPTVTPTPTPIYVIDPTPDPSPPAS